MRSPRFLLPLASLGLLQACVGDVSQASGFAAKFGSITGGLWSSTSVAGAAGSHWRVSSLRVTASADTATFDVRCVR